MSSRDISGVQELARNFRLSKRDAMNLARQTVTEMARDVRNEARQRVRKGPTGNLRKAIKSRRRKGSRFTAEASMFIDRSGGKSGKGFHWLFLEFGTVKMPADPFIKPSIDRIASIAPRRYYEIYLRRLRKMMEKRASK